MSGSELIAPLKKIYTDNLGAKQGERILVFTDIIPAGAVIDDVERSRRLGLVRIARAAAQAGEQLGLNISYTEFIALGSHGTEPDVAMWRLAFGDAATDELAHDGLLERLRQKKADDSDRTRAREIVLRHKPDAAAAVIALSNYSTSHTRFRDLLTSVCGTRYASMPLFEESMLSGSMGADWVAVKERSERISAAMRGMDWAHVTTPDGTDIKYSIAGRVALEDTGMLMAPGSFSNLPAGEVYVAPVEGTAEGVLVILWAPNRRLASPLKVVVRGGVAVEIIGDEPFAAELAASFARAAYNTNIAELGIGTNDKATMPDNVLESEKILGTVHMAFGDNSSMGGNTSTPFHQDFVYFSPTLVVGRGGVETTILDSGKLVV